MNNVKEETKVSAVAQALTASLGALKPFIQRTDLVTVKEINPKSGKNYTSKDKKVLGVPEDSEITWIPFHLPVHDNTRFNLLAKSLKTTGFKLGHQILTDWFEQNRDVIEEIVQDELKAEKSEDDLEKEVEAARRKYEKTMAELKARRG